MITIARPLIALTLGFTLAAGAQSRRVELNDLGREVGLSNPRLSPDGRQLVVIVSRANYTDNRFERSLYSVDITTGATRELTPGRRNVGAVEWSPTGDRLAFVDREVDKQPQLFVLPLQGGESRRITDAKRGVTQFAWRPDGQSFAFVAEDEPVEKTGEERLAGGSSGSASISMFGDVQGNRTYRAIDPEILCGLCGRSVVDDKGRRRSTRRRPLLNG